MPRPLVLPSSMRVHEPRIGTEDLSQKQNFINTLAPKGEQKTTYYIEVLN